MKRFYILGFVFLILSCNISRKTFFKTESPHEQYAARIKNAKLDQTAIARLWFAEADKAKSNPSGIQIPYKEAGYISADKPIAVGYLFSAKRGQQLNIQIQATPVKRVLYFTDLWIKKGNDLTLLLSGDSSRSLQTIEISKDADYVLRIQPEAMNSFGYTVTITSKPSLAFPIRESDDPKIISYWGASRDAGERKHEGIDIAAKKRTPVVACADGFITSVSENKLGGKVVFMRPQSRDYSLYYAHLDQQLVTTGQKVSSGDVLGLVGNTGNAATTIPHLHFGIYAAGGAIDPLPFVNPVVLNPKNISAEIQLLNTFSKISASQVSNGIHVSAETPAKIIAAFDDYYKLQLPDGNVTALKKNLLSVKRSVLKIKNEKVLRDAPDEWAAEIKILPEGTTVDVLGKWKNFQFVEVPGMKGWITE